MEGRRATGALPGVRGPDGQALPPDRIPKHVGVMLDGNRRWAKAVGADTAHGHRAGADNIEPLLGWCEEVGVEVVTLWLLSTDNLNRPPEELTGLLDDHRGSAVDDARRAPAAGGSTRSAPSTCCPPRPPSALKAAEDATRDVDGLLVNIAVGYGGRREIADAVRSLLARARRRGHHPRGARRGRSTSSTSPSTSTPRASPTPTW